MSEIKECPFIVGIICPTFASSGSPAMSNLQVWDDINWLPSGIRKISGVVVCWMSVTFALVVQKLLVAPESAIP